MAFRRVQMARMIHLAARRRLTLTGVTLALLTGGCGGKQAVDAEAIAALEARVADLERNNGRLRVRLQETEEQIFLLQDRVDANRVNLARRSGSVSLSGESAGVTAAARFEERPAPSPAPVDPRRYGSPGVDAVPPRPEVDPLGALPVHRLEPVPEDEIPPALEDAPAVEPAPEVVIDQQYYDAHFPTAAPSRGAAGVVPGGVSPVSGYGPRAQPMVDVGGFRLPPGPDPRPAPTDGGNEGEAPALAAAVPPPAVAPPGGDDGATPMAMYRAAVDQFNARDYSGALSTLDRFISTSPPADYMDNALFWMGESMYGLGRYEDALTYFQRVASDYPDGNKVPDALLKEALTWERLDNVTRARDVLSLLVSTYPSDSAADRARQRLRDL